MSSPRNTAERIEAAQKELFLAGSRWREASLEVDRLKKEIADATEDLRAKLLRAENDAATAKLEVAKCCRRLEGA